MRVRILVPAVLVSVAAGAPAGGFFPASGPGRAAPRVAAVHYRVVHGWPQLPKGRDLGEVAGVGVDPQGNVFVFHRNDREWPASDSLSTEPIALPTVTEFDGRTGKILSEWGTPGTGPGQFHLPHSVTLDASGRVYVSDRANARVRVFDASGHFLAQWKSAAIGRPYDIAIGADGTAFIADGGDQPTSPPDRSGVAVVGPNGTFRERFGSWGNYDGQFEIAHDIAMGPDGAIYVGDITGRRIQKFVPASP